MEAIKKKILIGVLVVILLAAIIAAVLFITHKPYYIAMDEELLDEAFSGKLEFPENSILDHQEGLVYENGKFRAEIDSLAGRFYSAEEIENGTLKKAMETRDYEFQLSDGSHIACNDWFLIKNRWHFYAGTVWQDPKVENGMCYTGGFRYLKGNFLFSAIIRCTDPGDTENMKALYAYIVEYFNENVVDIVQWQREHGYDV